MKQSCFKDPFQNISFKVRGYITLLSAFCQHLILGSFYVWGGILTYVASSLRQDGQNFTKEDVALLTPFITFSLNVGTPFGPILTQKIGYRPLMFLSSTLMSVSVFLSSFVVNNFPAFVIFYGVSFGIFSGILYMAPFNTVYLYFPERKGMVAGVITAGFALGSTVLIWIMYALINPENVKPNVKIDNSVYFSQDITEKLPNALRILSLIQLIFFYISSIFHLRPNQQEIEKIIYQNPICLSIRNKSLKVGDRLSSEEIMNQQKEDKFTQKNENQLQISTNNEFDSLKECLKTKFIYVSIVLATLFTLYGCLIFQGYKIIGERLGYSDRFLNIVGSSGCVMNCLSRIFWGNITEKYKFKNIATANLSLQIIFSFTFYWCSNNIYLFFFQVMMAYFTVGGWTSMMVALIVRVYGRIIGTTIYSITFIGFSLGYFISFFIMNSYFKILSLQHFIWIYTTFQVIALIIIFKIDFNVSYRKKIFKIQNSIKE